jgi:hypothetical protein
LHGAKLREKKLEFAVEETGQEPDIDAVVCKTSPAVPHSSCNDGITSKGLGKLAPDKKR